MNFICCIVPFVKATALILVEYGLRWALSKRRNDEKVEGREDSGSVRRGS